MIAKVFAIYDSASKCYGHPFHSPREETAIRAFADAVNSPSHDFAKHPADYTLYILGEFNDQDASYIFLKPGPKALRTGLAVLNRPAADSIDLTSAGGSV